jgi:site-specific recombinase XerD
MLSCTITIDTSEGNTAMGALQNSMRTTMEVQGYSDRTVEVYIGCVRVFANHFKKSPLLISMKEIESFFQFLRQQRKSDSTIHLYYVSLRFFYRINDISDRMPKLTFNRIQNKVPMILSQEKVITVLNSCKSLKYRTLFSLAYASGLRNSELRDLTVRDIDFDRKQVYVRRGKCGRSRYSIIGNKTIELLNIYMNVYKPHSFLFYNRKDSTTRVGKDAIRKELMKLLVKNGIDAHEVHLHTLRHCFATHLMESGTSIFHIMHLLGHASIHTTMVYLHMQDLSKLNITSPIDAPELHLDDATEPQKELFAETA